MTLTILCCPPEAVIFSPAEEGRLCQGFFAAESYGYQKIKRR
ncbi:hypothetical protein [Enterocloster clostridioformis]|jgi:hypothetical protein|nr:hypothetical protein [Enterocloster clostridioformis]